MSESRIKKAFEIFKTAGLKPEITLRPHQEEIVEQAKEGKTRLLLYHSLGSGKTLTSLAAAESSDEPYTAVVPASLRTNYRKEQEKFTDGKTPSVVASYTALMQGKVAPTRTVVFDEAQRLRNPGSETTRKAEEIAGSADNVYLLSGTPVVNQPNDLVPAIRMLTGEDYTQNSFDEEFVGQQRINPGVIGAIMGARQVYKPMMKNKEKFRELLDGHVDYFAPDKPGVDKLEERHVTEMTPDQEKLYKGFWGKLPTLTRWKLQNDYPLSKSEMAKLSSFMTGPRQVGLSTYPFMKGKGDALKAYRESPKLQQAVGLMREELDRDPESRAVAFSNFIGAGLTPYGAALEEAKVPYATFHGGLSDKERKSVVDQYNSGKIRALLLGPSGGEGISLKGTRLLQILDPHWNTARSEQAVGRGIRYDSHDYLPVGDRNVRVQRFSSNLRKDTLQSLWQRFFPLKNQEEHRKQNPGADTYLENMAAHKDELNNQFLDELKTIGGRKDAHLALANCEDEGYLRSMDQNKTAASGTTSRASSRTPGRAGGVKGRLSGKLEAGDNPAEDPPTPRSHGVWSAEFEKRSKTKENRRKKVLERARKDAEAVVDEDYRQIYHPDSNEFFAAEMSDILRRVKGRAAETVSLKSLERPRAPRGGWDRRRLDAVDTTVPIIIDSYDDPDGKISGFLVDGRYRLAKLREDGADSAQVIRLTNEDAAELTLPDWLSDDPGRHDKTAATARKDAGAVGDFISGNREAIVGGAIGGLAGAGVGALLPDGNSRKRSVSQIVAGALVGGGAGAAVGHLVGNQVREGKRRHLNTQPVSMVNPMSREGRAGFESHIGMSPSNYKGNYRPSQFMGGYGDKLGDEIEKAKDYSEKHPELGLDPSMYSLIDRDVPVYVGHAPGGSQFGSDGGEVYGIALDPNANLAQDQSLNQFQPGKSISHDEVLAHELRHSWQSPSLEALTRRLGIEIGSAPGVSTMSSSELHVSGHGLSASEQAGWAGGLQQELFRLTGKRLETPQEASSFIDKATSMSKEDFESAYPVSNTEALRGINWLRFLREKEGDKGRYDKLKNFMSTIFPGLVSSDQGSVVAQKTAATARKDAAVTGKLHQIRVARGAGTPQPATTVGRLMFESIVPEQFRGEAIGGDAELTSEKVNAILEQIAHKSPETYKDVSHKLLRLGAKGSVETNTSFSLDDLEFPGDREAVLAKISREEDQINSHPAWSDQRKGEERMNLWRSWGEKLPNQIFDESMKRDSRLARMVASGARGNRGQLNSNIGMDMAVSDSKGRQVPIPIKNSYSKGLTPAEYFAASYGTRLGIVATKFSCSGDTLVRMSNGSEKRIEDIVTGDWVAGADKDGNVIPVRVVQRFNNGIKPCRRHSFRIHSTQSLVSIDATDDHKMLAKIRAWGKAKKSGVNQPTQLPLGRAVSNSARQYVALPAQTGLDVPGSTEEYALLLGLLLGDGHVTETGQICLSCNDKSLLGDIESTVLGNNFTLKKASKSPKDFGYHLNYIDKPAKKIVVDDNPGFGGKRTETGCPFRGRIRGWGWMGRLAKDKTIPDEAWTWDNDSIAKLLGGLFSADGSLGKYTTKCVSIRLCLTSRKMLEQTRELLQVRFGIFTAEVSEVDVTNNTWAMSKQWILRISHRSSVRKFLEQIPLVGKKKNQAAELLQFLNDNPSFRGENTFSWVGSEDLGDIQTYDIEVDHPDHLFVLANGLITSNSVQDGGYFAKQLNAAAGDLIVTENDCGATGGYPVDPGDRESVGSVLARDFGGISAGTVLTPKILSMMSKSGKAGSKAVVRSPISCRAKQGGLCKMCSGVREQNRFPEIGENIGANAASGLSEPVSQALLCLAEGTKVRMADGSTKEIQLIEPGDEILGSNYEGKCSTTKVVRKYSNGFQPCMSRTFIAQIPGRTLLDEEPNIICTDNHKVLSHFGPRKVVDMAKETIQALCVWNRVAIFYKDEWSEHRSLMTYDIEVDHPCHMFVLACGLIVSNSTKHSAGVASAGGADQVRGFPQIDALAQVPSTYPNAATLAEMDGIVEKIEEAPQGGSYITVGGEKHYVSPEREIRVKVGASVEAGDAMSSGTPNPAEVVRHKGVGAGRSYFVTAFMTALKDNGTKADRRNSEVLARALVNHVRVGDEFESKEFMPDEIIEYSRLESSWVPSAGTKAFNPRQAAGKFLQRPSLHFTVGTRITPSVSKQMEEAGETEVFASDEAPSFSPVMVRAMENPAYKDDFMLHTGQSYVKRNLLHDVQSGNAKSDIHGKHMAPGLARGVEFGRPPKGIVGY